LYLRQVDGSMAPPQLFINTKTLQLEKQEIVNVDGNNQEWEDDKKDIEDDSDASDASEGTNGKDKNGKAKFPLPILSYILMFTGLAISLAGAFLGINKPANSYFFVLGLHLFSLGCLHLAEAPRIQSFSSLLDRWESCQKPKIARIMLATIASVANSIFAALEMYILFTNYDDFDCDYYGNFYFVFFGLMFSIFLALPWPLLLLWTTKGSTKTFSFPVFKIVSDPPNPNL